MTISFDFFQENKGFWVKWTRFSEKGSFWVHLPILQPFVHMTFLKELWKFDKNIQENQQEYTKFAKSLDSNKDTLEDNVREALEFGKKNHKYLEYKNKLLTNFLDLKLFEAFLEAGPQFAFQISVILQDGISGPTQLLTIVTSALSLTWASSELYLKYPTEVSICQIYIAMLNNFWTIYLVSFPNCLSETY